MALFEAIHYLEVAVRNRIDDALTQRAGAGVDWLDSPSSVPLNGGTRARIAKAREFASRHGRVPTHGHVIAEITFGFWPYLFADNYNRTLWQPALKRAFPTAQRTALHTQLTAVSDLRNRIAHHEPLLALDIAREYQGIISLAELVEPRLGWWIDTTSRVDAVHRADPRL